VQRVPRDEIDSAIEQRRELVGALDLGLPADRVRRSGTAVWAVQSSPLRNSGFGDRIGSGCSFDEKLGVCRHLASLRDL
jgi:hypothetical protein